MALRPFGIEDDNTFRGRANTALTQKIGDVVSPDMQKKLEALSVGTVTTGNAGTNAAVSITGTAPNQTINFTIPRGATGTAATITSATATGLAAGATPTVSLGGTSSARTFAFGIPAGAKGDKGDTGNTGADATAIIPNKPASDAPNTYPIGISLMQSDEGGYPAPFATVETVKHSTNRCYQEIIDRPSGRSWRRTPEAGGASWLPWIELAPNNPNAGGEGNVVVRHFANALRMRHATPVKVVCAGSSTMNGGNSLNGRKLVNRLSALTTTNPLKLDLADSSASDVQWWNTAVGGTQSSNYLTTTKVNQIGVIKPTLMLHSVGANDYHSQRPPSEYLTLMRSWFTQIQTVSPGTRHVYVVQQPRNDKTTGITYRWWEYTQQLYTLASEFPDLIAVADFGRDFEKIGLPGNDVWSLVSSDNVHLADEGNMIFARWIAEYLAIPYPHSSSTTYTTTNLLGSSGNYTGPITMASVAIPPAPYPRNGMCIGQAFVDSNGQSIEFHWNANAPAGWGRLARISGRGHPAAGQHTETVTSDLHIEPHVAVTMEFRYLSARSIYISGSESYTKGYVTLSPA